jgi:hypothetical protein
MSNDDPNASKEVGQAAVPPELQEKVNQDLGALGETAKHELDAVTQRAKDDARKLGEHAGEKITEATDKAKSFASDQKALAAGQITGVAEAINKVAVELEGTDQQTVARYARDLASGLSSMGKTIEERDVDDLMGMAQDFGRKQPVAFLGAAALAGFVASRFALASNHRRDQKAASPTTNYQAEGSSGYAPSTSTNTRTGGQ